MHPTFELGPLDFPAYFTFLTIGYLLAVLLAWRESFKLPDMDPNKVLDLSILMLITGLLGARILHVLADGHLQDYINLCLDPFKVEGKGLPRGVPCISDAECVTASKGGLCDVTTGLCHPARDCLRTIKIWYGGLAFYGGLLLCIPIGIWYILRNKGRLALWTMADLAGFGIALGLIFGRIGCWFSGCCFGEVTNHPMGVTFPKYSPAWDRHIERELITRAAETPLPVIPTQLVHVIANASIFIFCYWMFKKWRKFEGSVFWTFMLLYGISRFVIEWYRDDHRGVWLGDMLSTSQLLGIPVIIGASIMLYVLRNRVPKPPLAEPTEPTSETAE